MEVDIIEMIKTGRYVKMALRNLLASDVRMDLKQRSRYIMIDPDAVYDEEEAQKNEMQFATVLDKIEYELN